MYSFMFLSLTVGSGGGYESPLTPKGNSPKLMRACKVEVGKILTKWSVSIVFYDHKNILHYFTVM